MSLANAKTIVKGLLSTAIVPGTFMTLMGLGLVPVDDKLASIAAPFIGPIGLPFRAFVCVLGPCKILGSLALWKIGPMPEWFARIGLMVSSSCAVYGHSSIGDPVAPPLGYIGLMFVLYALDYVETREEIKKE